MSRTKDLLISKMNEDKRVEVQYPPEAFDWENEQLRREAEFWEEYVKMMEQEKNDKL